jgi:hypothetical protein
MEKPPIVYDDFATVDIRIGRIVAVKPFERARNPSYKVEVPDHQLFRGRTHRPAGRLRRQHAAP